MKGSNDLLVLKCVFSLKWMNYGCGCIGCLKLVAV